jgi:hypothetical protein
VTFEWKIEVRNAALQRVGELDDYQSLEMVLKFNDVSTWTLSTTRCNRLAAELVLPGAGIVVTRNGATVLSGPWTKRRDAKSADRDQITMSGVDDTVWLNRREASPVPSASGPPYSAQASDLSSGVASTVLRDYVNLNAGPGAVAVRRVPGLTIGTDPVVGASVAGTARWQVLLPMLQELATAGAVDGVPIGFRVVQVGTGLEFQTYQPADLTATAVFSSGFGNLEGFEYEVTAPEANYVFVGGAGEGTARVIQEKPDSASVAKWGRIEGELVDARNAASVNELDVAATKALADNTEKTSLSITPIDTDLLAFGVHYGLGDRVTAVLDAAGVAEDIITGTATGQGTSIDPDYLIATDEDSVDIPLGSRVRLYNSAGELKEQAVLVVTARNSAFGFTNIEFTPPAAVSTVAGDYLEAFVSPPTAAETVQDVVRECNIKLTSDEQAITPALGGEGITVSPLRFPRQLGKVLKRLNNLERR